MVIIINISHFTGYTNPLGEWGWKELLTAPEGVSVASTKVRPTLPLEMSSYLFCRKLNGVQSESDHEDV